MEQKYYKLNVADKPDQEIWHYLDYHYLLEVLNGQFYISDKSTFDDVFDVGKRVDKKVLLKLFIVQPVDQDLPCQQSGELVKKHDILINNIKKSYPILTSCWSKTGDDYLMWRAHTKNDCGVCIKSTVNDFLLGLDYQPNQVYCSSVLYEGYSQSMDFLQYLFSKEKNYQSENEFRFCFLPENCMLEKCTSTDDLDFRITEQNHLHMRFEPRDAIKEIILSPNMSPQKRKQISELFMDKYPYLEKKIKDSKIQINHEQ